MERHYLYRNKDSMSVSVNRYWKIDVTNLPKTKILDKNAFVFIIKFNYHVPFLAASKYWLAGNSKYMFLLIAYLLYYMFIEIKCVYTHALNIDRYTIHLKDSNCLHLPFSWVIMWKMR